jgi:hypothetical protein
VGDIRKRTAIAPRVRAVLYTWGGSMATAEGEPLPVQVGSSVVGISPAHWQHGAIVDSQWRCIS